MIIALIGAFLCLMVLKRFILGRIKAALSNSAFANGGLLIAALHWPLTILMLCVDLILLRSLLEYFGYEAVTVHKIIDVLLLSVMYWVIGFIKYIGYLHHASYCFVGGDIFSRGISITAYARKLLFWGAAGH